MRRWFQGKWEGLCAFTLISALIFGGLGWASQAALQLEQQQLMGLLATDRAERLSRALWRLDSRVGNLLAREEVRPFNHYSAVFATPLALDARGMVRSAGSVLEPSPLLGTPLPPWLLLHFQADSRGWQSPQVLSAPLRKWLTSKVPLENASPAREQLLAELNRQVPPQEVIALARQHTGQEVLRERVRIALRLAEADNFQSFNSSQKETGNNRYNPTNEMAQQSANAEFAERLGSRSKLTVTPPVHNLNFRVPKDIALNNTIRNGEEWLESAQNNLVPSPLREETEARLRSNQQARRSTNGTLSMGGGDRGGVPPPGLGPAPAQGGAVHGTGSLVPSVQRFLEQQREPEQKGAETWSNSAEVVITLSPLVGQWLPTPERDLLVALRLVKVEDREVAQGVLLDSALLMSLLAEDVQDLFPEARVVPACDEPEPDSLGYTMTTLPLRLETGPEPSPENPGWTTLRLGLLLAWSAALLALGAVGLGGWSLLDLSERRIRFVSAVTHELRTPLTTLRLYLDMLLGGLVQSEPQRNEYLLTLNAETDRLNRLVSNVLDFSRLENQPSRLVKTPIDPSALLQQIAEAWQVRCHSAGKELLVEAIDLQGVTLTSDEGLLTQVLGNLLDNACKYSREAADPRLWLRVRRCEERIVFEVEDRGPGVPARESRAIFRPFRRGHASATTTGGVGLGLSLARRWANLLGGQLTLHTPAEGGACFRLTLG